MKLTLQRYRIFVLVLALLGLVFAGITTSKYGAGVSSDAVRAMSTAEGLLAGKGFIDFVGSPYVLWPPLYPLLLAGLSLLTRLDIFHLAWYLNLLLFPLNIWLWGVLFERIFPERLWHALIAGSVAVFSSSMIRIYANVASDPLFVTLMILFFLFAGEYLQTGSRNKLWWMLAVTGLGMLQRYLGVVFFGAAGLVVILRDGYRGVGKVLLPGLVSVLPLAAWLIFHNYIGYGTLFGGRAYDEMWPLENISLSLTKVLHWFLPYAPGLKAWLLRPWSLLLPAALALVILNLRHRQAWAEMGKALRAPYVWPALLSSLVYYFLLAFTVNTIDHRDLTSDRYYIVLLPVIMIFLLLVWEHLLAPRLAGVRPVQFVLPTILLLWFLYPLYDLQEYLRLSLVNGEPSNYNIYNSSHFSEMQVLKEGRRLAEENPEATIYSNYVNLLWFQYKRPIRMLLPVDNELSPAERAIALQEKYAGWPGKQAGYIVWFTPNEYKYLAAPQDLAAIAQLELIYRDDNGEIYRVTPR